MSKPEKPVNLQLELTRDRQRTIDGGGVLEGNQEPDQVSQDAAPGSTQTNMFTAPQSGTVSFHGKFHPTKMTGTFTVGSGGGSQSFSAAQAPQSGGGGNGGYYP